jgi:hypothetical protein
MIYSRPLYRKEDVNEAGDCLIGNKVSLDITQCFDIINNWRGIHAFPLDSFYSTLKKRAKKIDGKALVYRRQKRLVSIYHKLLLYPTMRLSQMQDIGGCRAIVGTVDEVDALVSLYTKGGTAKNPAVRHKLVGEKDYISTPKDTGYRSYHLVFAYCSRKKEHSAYNKLKIEIQIRSRLQHAWATAVEVVSAFTGQALKSNIGDDQWKRFFKLMGSELAIREGRPLVPDTTTDYTSLISEIKQLAIELNIENVLFRYAQAVKVMTEKMKGAHLFLLELDIPNHQLRVTGFSSEELQEAQRRYMELEKEHKGDNAFQAVLVGGGTISSLRRAYPNFYLDSSAFMNAVRLAISEDATNGK